MKRTLPGFWAAISAVTGIVMLLAAINQIFMLNPFGLILMDNSYYYLLLGLGMAQMFLSYGATQKAVTVPWYDILCALLSVGCCVYFAWHGRDIIAEAWEVAPPNETVVGMSMILCLLLLEGVRRTAGLALLCICFIFMLYPAIAHLMPGVLEGHNLPLEETMTFHALSSQSIVGLTMGVVGSLLIGYITFGVVLNATGGGSFFLNFAFALLGRFRGGSAKVAVLASAIFGSMSGSAISNVATTGVITIPVMKQSGFKPEVAGAIEACASTGGVLMPPVMGAAAFLMAQFLGIPYLEVAMAALIPSLLYYLGLLVQVDGIAAVSGIKGLSREELPRLRSTLRAGWIPLLAFAILIYFLIARLEDRAPFFAVAFMLLAAMLCKANQFSIRQFLMLMATVSSALSELIVTIAGVGFIIGAMSLTGVGASISGEMVALAQGNIYLMLVFGALTSFVLGMGMSTSACYIFLAVVLAPGLIAGGLAPLAVHLFILYWAMASNITPPVALACFPAANISGAPYMKVACKSVQLGFVTFIVPFLFVLDPHVIFIGTPMESAIGITIAAVGVVTTSFGLTRYLPFVGHLSRVAGVLLTFGGILLALPTTMTINLISLVCTIVLVLFLFIQKK